MGHGGELGGRLTLDGVEQPFSHGRSSWLASAQPFDEHPPLAEVSLALPATAVRAPLSADGESACPAVRATVASRIAAVLHRASLSEKRDAVGDRLWGGVDIVPGTELPPGPKVGEGEERQVDCL